MSEPSAGSRAREQLDAARNDPRTQRDEAAFLADYNEYLTEADRVRMLAIKGIEALADGETDDTLLAPERRQQAWEQRELARAYAATQHAHLNGLALVGMVGNLESLVERLGPAYSKIRAEAVPQLVDGIIDRLVEAREVDAGFLARLREAAIAQDQAMQPVFGRARGRAPERWEEELAKAGLSADAQHRLPQDMADSLAEIVQLRNVLVHRSGRVDAKALQIAPTLATNMGLAVGDFVRIDRDDYRRYVAALRCYGLELQRRVFRGERRLAAAFQVDLDHWRSYGVHYG